MRRRRFWRWALPVAAALVAVLCFVGGKWYLRREVMSQLVALNDAPVSVGQVSLGIRRHQVRGVRLHPSATDEDAWAEFEQLTIELPIWRALLGRTKPQTVDVSRAVVRLRLDDHGKLLTRLPGTGGEFRLPAETIAIHNARVEILRQSRPPVVADSIRADVQQDDEGIYVAGVVGTALNAQWSFDAQANTATSQVSGHLQTQSLRITTDQLSAEGLLPLAATPDLRAETVTAVQFRFRHVAKASFRYRLELSPHTLDVRLGRFAWKMTGGAGSIVLKDGLADVREMSGTTWGGRLAIDGQADLRHHPWRGRFEVAVRDVTPPARLLPADAADIALGRCSGNAEFDVTLRPEGMRVAGDGKGTIHQANLLGVRPEPMAWQVSFEMPARGGATPLSGTLRLDATAPDIDVQDVLRRFEVDTDQLAATASLTGILNIPLESLTDPRTYDFTGDLQSPTATIAGFETRNLRMACSYERGRLKVREFSGRIADNGHFSGRLQVDTHPDGEIDGRLEFDGIPNATLARMLSTTQTGITGASQGWLELQAPASDWRNLRAWTGRGEATCRTIRVHLLELADITTQFGLRNGRIELTEGSVAWRGTSLRIHGNVDVLAPHQFAGRMEVSGIDLAAIAAQSGTSLSVSLGGSGELRGSVRGRLTPFAWSADGTGQLPDLTVAGRSVEKTQFRWNADPSGLDVHGLTATALGGHIEAAAKIPFDELETSRVQGTFENLDASQLQDLIPATWFVLGGRVSGQLELTNVGTSANQTAELQFRGVELTAYDISLDAIRGSATCRADRADFDVVGDVLGGTVGFRGHVPLGETAPTAVRLDGRAELKEIRLAEVWRSVNVQHRLHHARAVLEGNLDVQLVGESCEPRAQGHLHLHHPSWGSTELASLAEADIDLQEQNLRVTKLVCRVAGGMLTGGLTMRIGKHANGTFALGVERVALDKLTAMLGGPRGQLAGTVDAAIAGQVRSEWKGRAVLRLTNARLAGVPVSSLTAPIDWAFAPSSGRARAKARLNSAKVAGGRVSGNVDLRWTGQFGIDANVDFDSLTVQPMARAMPMVTDQLQGKLSGHVDVSGSSVRSIDDLTGSFDGSLKQSQALLIPVLQSLTSSLGLGGSSSRMFTETAVKGRFSRGVIHVDRMTMNSNDVRMYITGKMTRRGNLDLDVTADVPQVTVAAVAVGVLRPAALLRRRLLFLKLDGSVRSPIVRPRTAEFIRQEVILFFWPFVMTP